MRPLEQFIAECVKTAAQMDALLSLGVYKAQGYFLGRPTPLADALKLCT